MTLVPTWDLFILILFVVIIAYSFIIGREKTGKVVIATYIAILAADGLGNLFYQYFVGPGSGAGRIITIQSGSSTIITIKILLLVALIVGLALKGGFESKVGSTAQQFLGVLVTATLGFLSAGLVVSAILVFASGGSFLPGTTFQETALAASIYNNSQIARLILDNFSLWFSLPAVAFMFSSFMEGN